MAIKPSKALIIKTGYSETLERNVNGAVSYGDVLSSTVLLHPFKDYHITWLTDKACMPLLAGNPHIDRLLPYELMTVLQLREECFDVLVNLEKVPGLCALADSIRAHARYGFGFDARAGEAKAYPKSYTALAHLEMRRDLAGAIKYYKPTAEVLFEAVGRKWEGEEYVLGYQPPRLVGSMTVGLNHEVGPKWPTKAWSRTNFAELGHRLEDAGYAASTQRGFGDLREYMDWIGGCSTIVTNDSLGMHLAIALRKNVVALFGPTSPERAHLYGRGVKLVSKREAREHCMPCYKRKCKYEVTCMDDITVEQVLAAVKKLNSKQEAEK